MEVILLGTGGPRPDPRRMATTTLIRLGEENILIDAGRGVMVQLNKAGVPLGSINTVFLTRREHQPTRYRPSSCPDRWRRICTGRRSWAP